VVLRTSKNLTIAGLAGIAVIIGGVLVALFDGDPNTNVNWELALVGIYNGIVAIMSKGQASTGGVVDAAGKPVEG